VMMTDAQKAATEVILGVDTHLDVHVALALETILAEKLGRVECAHDGEGLGEVGAMG
jgi:hypothetical protein